MRKEMFTNVYKSQGDWEDHVKKINALKGAIHRRVK